jgi:hypothetical protein
MILAGWFQTSSTFLTCKSLQLSICFFFRILFLTVIFHFFRLIKRYLGPAADRRGQAPFDAFGDVLGATVVAWTSLWRGNDKMAGGIVDVVLRRGFRVLGAGYAACVPFAVGLLGEVCVRGVLGEIEDCMWVRRWEDVEGYLAGEVLSSCPMMQVEVLFYRALVERWKDGDSEHKERDRRLQGKLEKVYDLAKKSGRRWWQGMVAAQSYTIMGGRVPEFENHVLIEDELGCRFYHYPNTVKRGKDHAIRSATISIECSTRS